MTDPIVSPDVFKWTVTLITGIVAGVWFLYDAYSLSRLRQSDLGDPLVRDKRFGYLIGMVIGAIGVIGCLRFHGVM
jgi:hypothetical protein